MGPPCNSLFSEEDKAWSPDDFLHLLKEACTTLWTGDVGFHRLLGRVGNAVFDLGEDWSLGPATTAGQKHTLPGQQILRDYQVHL